MEYKYKWVAGYFVGGDWIWHKADGVTTNVHEALYFDTRDEANLAPRDFSVIRLDQFLAFTAVANKLLPAEELNASSEELLKILNEHRHDVLYATHLEQP